MKKLKISVFLMAVVLMFTGVFAGCNGGENNGVTSSLDEASAVDTASNESVVSTPKEPKGDPNAPKSLKVLSIGHSYSIDAMQYLWEIANDAGVEEIKLGILYYAGCPLDRHWQYISEDIVGYEYHKNVAGTWVKYKDTSAQTAIEDEKWDIVTLQQGPSESGIESTFGNLENIISYVKNQLPEAKLFWHLTWANQSDYRSQLFETNYGCDQMKMYNAIISTYASRVMPIKDFEAVIPCGTVIQNLRTSYLGDTLTRDGYHLSHSYGCYAAGLTWYAALCNGNVDAITWYPENFPELKSEAVLIRQSVKDAIDDPFVISQQQK